MSQLCFTLSTHRLTKREDTEVWIKPPGSFRPYPRRNYWVKSNGCCGSAWSTQWLTPHLCFSLMLFKPGQYNELYLLQPRIHSKTLMVSGTLWYPHCVYLLDYCCVISGCCGTSPALKAAILSVDLFHSAPTKSAKWLKLRSYFYIETEGAFLI